MCNTSVQLQGKNCDGLSSSVDRAVGLTEQRHPNTDQVGGFNFNGEVDQINYPVSRVDSSHDRDQINHPVSCINNCEELFDIHEPSFENTRVNPTILRKDDMATIDKDGYIIDETSTCELGGFIIDETTSSPSLTPENIENKENELCYLNTNKPNQKQSLGHTFGLQHKQSQIINRKNRKAVIIKGNSNSRNSDQRTPHMENSPNSSDFPAGKVSGGAVEDATPECCVCKKVGKELVTCQRCGVGRWCRDRCKLKHQRDQKADCLRVARFTWIKSIITSRMSSQPTSYFGIRYQLEAIPNRERYEHMDLATEGLRYAVLVEVIRVEHFPTPWTVVVRDAANLTSTFQFKLTPSPIPMARSFILLLNGYWNYHQNKYAACVQISSHAHYKVFVPT